MMHNAQMLEYNLSDTLGSSPHSRFYNVFISLSLPDSTKNVGAHNPTKMPNLSAWAISSTEVPFVSIQIAMDPIMDANPIAKHSPDSCLSVFWFIGCRFY